MSLARFLRKVWWGDRLLVDCPSCSNPVGKKAFQVPSLDSAALPKDLPPLLSKLPNELWLCILRSLHPVDQVCLALTCKRLLSVSQMITIMLPFGPGHPRSGSLFPCDALVRLLHRVQPPGPSGVPDGKLFLCWHCFRIRPMQKSYWIGVRKKHAPRLAPHYRGGYWMNVEVMIRNWIDGWTIVKDVQVGELEANMNRWG
ncbi:hypothetical protein PG985_016101 [Apiospora marii]|uniref:uncharacterized protein n=1 Tax=Apiospora marii TaxID=335849 RepID=UPI00312E1B43